MFKSNVVSFEVKRSLVCSVAKSTNGRLLGITTERGFPNGLNGVVCPMKSLEAGLKSESAPFRMRSSRGPLMPWNCEICWIWLYMNAPS